MPFLDNTRIEIVRADSLRSRLRQGKAHSVLFDFDGTLSLIRQGWQDIMVPMMVEILEATDTQETTEELTEVVTGFVDRLTGRQTIYQMIELCKQVAARGGQPLEPLKYKHDYLNRLWAHIRHRVQGLRRGTISVLDMVVPGTFGLLDDIRSRGLACYLASGTDQPYVLDEAEVLGLTPYFADGAGTRIYGALDQYERFSKAQVIQEILRTRQLGGNQLLAFGDGFVEIEETKAVGGIAVGVASDEARRQGIDEWKRERLVKAGADVIIADFCEHEALLSYLLDR
jgi:phosphoglycolate phosphatase-like HAD superfamily hydrolase